MTASIIVEQLNRSQWHVVMPGERASGVTDWVSAVSRALLWGTCEGSPVESVDLDYNWLTLAQGGPGLEVRP